MLSTVTIMAMAALLPCQASALPTGPSQPSCPWQEMNANFDDIPSVPGTSTNPVPIPYKGLYFQGYQFANVIQTNTAPGVPPHSPMKSIQPPFPPSLPKTSRADRVVPAPRSYAISTTLSKMTQGTNMLTTNYPSSKAKAFDLETFYYTCQVTVPNGATALPAECLISITGYTGKDNTVSDSNQVCSQQFHYLPCVPLPLPLLLLSLVASTGKMKLACIVSAKDGS